MCEAGCCTLCFPTCPSDAAGSSTGMLGEVPHRTKPPWAQGCLRTSQAGRREWEEGGKSFPCELPLLSTSNLAFGHFHVVAGI